MKITVYSIGKTKENYVLTGEAEYLKRLRPHCQIELIELGKVKEGDAVESVTAKEADLIIDRIKDGSFIIALDQYGTELTSEELSEFIGAKAVRGISHLIFVIGGAWGLHERVKKRANFVLSLSKMTFPHQLARLFLIEQLYRSFSIAKGEPYHK